ncbi:hypothetical protein LCGC14_1330990 [marine sediment metagenome]|uniref:Phage nucleotide-binding protein n=1 Tax=marine sediment metagenome TaxID=412755 RepID=A0A0F9MXF3_9ZZZZ
MKIENTQKDYKNVASINMLVYGVGGVGKSTFASTFPKPIIFDFENGAKYFKQRGIDVDVIRMDSWFKTSDKKELIDMVKNYETIIFDPIGEAMDKLIKSEEITGAKYRQSDGALTMSGWGKVKDDMRSMIKWARDTGKHVIIVAHDSDAPVAGSEGSVKKVPLIATKLGAELVNMVDIVAYLDILQIEGEPEKRVLRVNPADMGYIAKDRTETLGKFVKPDFNYINEQIMKGQTEEKKTTAKKPVSKAKSKTTKKEAKVDDTISEESNPFPDGK